MTTYMMHKSRYFPVRSWASLQYESKQKWTTETGTFYFFFKWDLDWFRSLQPDAVICTLHQCAETKYLSFLIKHYFVCYIKADGNSEKDKSFCSPPLPIIMKINQSWNHWKPFSLNLINKALIKKIPLPRWLLNLNKLIT